MLSLREDLYRQHIPLATGEVPGGIDIVRTKGAGNLIAARELLSVQPDIRAVVDAVEVQPCGSSGRRRRSELGAIPPGAVIGTFVAHWQVAEDLPHGVVHAGDLAQVHPEEWIGENPSCHLRTKYRSRDGRIDPAVGPIVGQGDAVA